MRLGDQSKLGDGVRRRAAANPIADDEQRFTHQGLPDGDVWMFSMIRPEIKTILRSVSKSLIALGISLLLTLSLCLTTETVAQSNSAIAALQWNLDGSQLAIVHGGDSTTCLPGYSAPYTLELISSTATLTQVLSDTVCELGSVAFSSDGLHIITRSRAGRLHVMDTSDLNIIEIIDTMSSGGGLKASPTEPQFIIIENNTSASIYELTVSNDDVLLNIVDSINMFSQDHSELIIDADWDSTGTMIATSSDDGTVAVWDLAQDNLIVRVSEPDGEAVKLVSWSKAGDAIAFANQSGRVSVWDISEENILLNLPAHSQRLNRLVWSPDGARLASASEDGTVKVWNAQTGTLIETLTYPGPVYALDWSPDGTKIAYGGADLSGNPPQVMIVDAPEIEPTPTPTVSGTHDDAFSTPAP